MTTVTVTSTNDDFSLFTLLRHAWQFNWLLTLAIALHVLLIPAVLIGMLIDPKVITGENGWFKPLKFAISGGLYALTMLWLLTCVQTVQTWKRWLVQSIASITGFALILELALIAMQVVRGVRSHFNFSTIFNSIVVLTMGIAITIVVTLHLVAAILLILQRMENRTFAWGVRLGVLAALVGLSVGYLMLAGPTPIQLESVRNGGELTVIGAHSVGVEDGGSGLPFVGWSTQGGDLRVPHFVGLHGMQVLPLLGWLLSRCSLGLEAQHRCSKKGRTTLVLTAGLGYIAWIVLLIWQAQRGQSIIAPDALTWAGYGVIVGSIVLGNAGTLALTRSSS